MARRQTGRQTASFLVSAAIHVGFALGLIFIPQQIKKHYDIVDMEVQERQRQPEPEVEPEEPAAPEVEPEIEKPSARPAPRPRKPDPVKEQEPPPAPPPDADKAPPDADEAPPVFDLGDNTFSTGAGQQGGWSLARSEGNTKFAGVAGRQQKPVRGTKPKGDPEGKPGGKGSGFKPVPIKDLSRRPEPADGPITLPKYPPEASREGIEGIAVLQVFIGKDGRVKNVRIVKDPGGGLGQVARKRIFEVRWKPALDKSGAAVDTVITYTFRFVLNA